MKSGPRRQYRMTARAASSAATSERIVEAAVALFYERPLAGVVLEDVASRAGVSAQTVLRHFGSREGLFAAAMREWRRSTAKGLTATESMRAALQQRIERVMSTTLSREIERLDRHMIFLASVGSTAPFVGLFGTVWGIMNSFQSIAVSKNTSLAVVAPGIAEALFATAIGLVAAIPAVIAYNKISGDINRYAGRLEAFINDFAAILSRQLQEKQ